MNNSVVITAVLSALVTLLFMYIDARLFDSPKSKFAYFKGMCFVSALSATIVYFMGRPALPQMGGAPQPFGTAYVEGIGQEIFTGIPEI